MTDDRNRHALAEHLDAIAEPGAANVVRATRDDLIDQGAAAIEFGTMQHGKAISADDRRRLSAAVLIGAGVIEAPDL